MAYSFLSYENRVWLIPALVLMLLTISCLICRASYAQQERGEDIRYVQPNAETGTSQAVVVGDIPLAHTDLFLPLDAEGTLIEGGAELQIDRVLEHLRLALAEVGADLNDIVKVNVYAAHEDAIEYVKEQFAEAFSGAARPAVTYMVGRLPHEGALVAMDAVAAASAEEGASPSPAVHQSELLYGPSGQGDVAVMPRGEKVYISGQAEGSDDLLEAVRGTMQSLHATLAYLGLSAEDVVQVKAFMQPIEQAQEVERVIAEYYRKKPAPPVVAVEWLHGGLPTEIELIASRAGSPGEAGDDEVMSFVTPPGMSSSPTFSRLAEVHRGDLVYVSGLYGTPCEDAEEQVRTIFERLGGVLEEAGSDFDHLAKATYYHTTGAASQQLNDVRPAYYNPERPPAASKAKVRGVGREECSVTTDMIAVSPE